MMGGDCLPSDTGKSKLSGTVQHEHLRASVIRVLFMLTKALAQVSPAGSIFVFCSLAPYGWEGLESCPILVAS